MMPVRYLLFSGATNKLIKKRRDFPAVFFKSWVFILAIPKLLLKQESMKVVITDFFKRILDIVGALVALIVTLPLWLIIPLLIKITSPGPVIYSQIRVGVNRRNKIRRTYQKTDINEQRIRERRRDDYLGDTFKVYKFRTMVIDAEKETGPVWATRNDSRITKIGSLLRKTRIDEIPQFINVLKGEMSLVGPRPERPVFVKELFGKVDGYLDRLQVKPGITGLAQIENGYDESVNTVVNKVRYDLEYIKKRSFWLDIKILLRTVIVVITGKGAN